jgi:hypothetical protein
MADWVRLFELGAPHQTPDDEFMPLKMDQLPYQYDPIIRAFGPIGQVRVLGRQFSRQKANLIEYLKNNVQPARPIDRAQNKGE